MNLFKVVNTIESSIFKIFVISFNNWIMSISMYIHLPYLFQFMYMQKSALFIYKNRRNKMCL